MANGLPVSRLVNVDVIVSPQAAQGFNFNSLLILGDSDVIDTVTRIREYSGIDEVAEAFGTNAPEYQAALLWFSQSPQPDNVFVGRWVRVAAPAQLLGGVLSTEDQDIGNFTGITNGGMTMLAGGATVAFSSSIDFSAQTNLNGVAEVLSSLTATVDFTWDAVNNNFNATTVATGDAATISFASAPGGGLQDISQLLGFRSTDGGYLAQGLDAETPLEAVVIMDNLPTGEWYGLTFAASVMPTNDQMVAVAGYVEAASSPPHFLGVTSQEAGVLSPVSTTDLPYRLMALSYKKSSAQYSSSSPYAITSALARILTTNWRANNTTITLMYKQEPGVVAENLTSTQATVVQDKNCNVFVNYNNDTAIFQYGTVANGDFVDSVIGIDWLANEIQTELYNLLYTSTTKVPQTDAGNALLGAAVSNACSRGVNNGLLAPGVWNQTGFGQLKQGDTLPAGFYVYVPPIATQSQADREARKSVPIQVAAKLAGAVHTVDVILNVNR